MAEQDALSAPANSVPDAAAPTAKARSVVRWLVPLALFVGIIGGIAWLSQNMPSWRAAPKAAVKSGPKGPNAILRFIHPHLGGVYQAVWGLPNKKVDKQPYVREFEQGEKASYHFPGKVFSEEPVEFGVGRKSCDCAKLFVAVIPEGQWSASWEKFHGALRSEPGIEGTEIDPAAEVDFSQAPANSGSWKWQPLDDTDKRGITLPAGCEFVLRMDWENRRPVGERLNLNAHIWVKSPGSARQDYGVNIPAVCAAPLRSKNDRVDVGTLEPDGKTNAEFLVWSPTRSEAAFSISERDPLFQIATERLAPADCLELQGQLRQADVNTRVRAAWKVRVTIRAKQGDRQLNQGHFTRSIKIDMPTAAGDLPSLLVVGRVRGDITVGAVEDQGRIHLKSFPAKYGASRRVTITSAPSVTLTKESAQPPGLQVTLKKGPDPAAGRKQEWHLDVVVPPNLLAGTIGDDCVVVLGIDRGKGAPRDTLRIPLAGSAVQD